MGSMLEHFSVYGDTWEIEEVRQNLAMLPAEKGKRIDIEDEN